MELIGASMKGIYRDVLRGPDTRMIYDSGWKSNTIVDSFRILLASFIKNEPSGGLSHLAVGQGEVSWDTSGAPPPGMSTEGLVDPHGKFIEVGDNLQLAYLDSAGRAVNEPTSRLQITATLGPDYPEPLPTVNSYPLREFGLFAKLGGENYMLNCIRHPVIHKDAATTLVRVIRLYF